LPAPLLSICIPTYNRAQHLQNCLHSIALACPQVKDKIEVCISDNASEDETPRIIAAHAITAPVRTSRNDTNLGIPRNFLNVVGLATGEFAWLVGDDDIMLPDGLVRMVKMLEAQPDADFFYVNAFHHTTEKIMAQPQPFDPRSLPTTMERFSGRTSEGTLPFLDLISPDTSFDFLGGMFLSIFRRGAWARTCHVLDHDAIHSETVFSHFDNTFPHVRIFATAFAGRTACFNAEPPLVCLTGAREWAPKYKMIRSFRLVEALKLYRAEGLSSAQYHRCRNFAIRDFFADILWMRKNKKRSGWDYVPVTRNLIENLRYPNLYLSPFRLIAQRVMRVLGR